MSYYVYVELKFKLMAGAYHIHLPAYAYNLILSPDGK